jgi:hypothetical protein
MRVSFPQELSRGRVQALFGDFVEVEVPPGFGAAQHVGVGYARELSMLIGNAIE